MRSDPCFFGGLKESAASREVPRNDASRLIVARSPPGSRRALSWLVQEYGSERARSPIVIDLMLVGRKISVEMYFPFFQRCSPLEMHYSVGPAVVTS